MVADPIAPAQFEAQDVYSISRMGTYRYLDIGNIIEQCFELQDKIGKAR
jgi:UDP-galactopyranose mutase